MFGGGNVRSVVVEVTRRLSRRWQENEDEEWRSGYCARDAEKITSQTSRIHVSTVISSLSASILLDSFCQPAMAIVRHAFVHPPPQNDNTHAHTILASR